VLQCVAMSIGCAKWRDNVASMYVCCRMLQRVAACCSVLQCVAINIGCAKWHDNVADIYVCCSMLQCVVVCYKEHAVCKMAPQHSGYVCVLQYFAVCCNVLQ